MNTKISLFAICVEAIIYLSLYNLHDCTFNHLIGNNCPEFRNGHLDCYIFKLTLGSDCLELCFWIVIFKTILTQ